MADKIIDIVVTTMNRLDYLKQTLSHIYERTRWPYRLHVLDDNSDEGNVDYLIEEWKAGRVHHLLLHGERVGEMAQLNMGSWMAVSDPVVFVDDDVLCPDVEPCWLERGRRAILERPRVGLLALNHPGAVRKIYDKDKTVTYCKFVGGTFMFVRRAFLTNHPLPHFRANFGVTPTTKRCGIARAKGWLIGYLTNTYCQHIGRYSILNDAVLDGRREITDIDPVTLEPVDPRWRK